MWARISVVAAGPIFNFIMAFIFSAIVLGAAGVDKPILSDVIEGYAAEEAGLAGGDTLIKIGSKRIHFYREVSVYATFHVGEPVEIVYEREGQEHATTLVPKYDEE